KGFGYGEVEAIEITAGDRHVCARTVDNRLKCWGYNSYGQLGLGHSTNVGRNSISEMLSLPYVQLGTGRTVKSITAGPTHTCAVLDNDTIKCWGSNMDRKLGTGSTMDVGGNPGEMGDALPSVNLGSSNPLPLMTSISSYATCALLEVSGIRDVRCWGS